MALVDPYSPCPCGSGQKYKWCCQKVESYAERAQRLVENGQYESALKPLDEGLAKVPANPWLSTRKALVQLQLKQFDAAKVTLRELLQKHPDNLVGSILLTRVVLETEGPIEAAAQFQQALSARPAGQRGELAPLASLVGSALGQAGFYAAALKHLELAGKLGADEPKQSSSLIRSLRTNPAISLWEKNPYRLWPAPEQATEAFRESFERALGWANEGLWSSAASAFELLAAGSGAGAIADRNRGLCCLWIADHEGAVAALAPLHRADRPHARRGRPRGPLPEDRPQRALRSSRVRSPELADPQPRRFAGRAAGRSNDRRGAQPASRSQRSQVSRGRTVLSARSSPDRGEKRAQTRGNP